MQKLGLVAWALVGTLLTYAAYFFMCGMTDPVGVLVTAGAAVVCVVVAIGTGLLVKTVKKRVMISCAASFALLAVALCFVSNLSNPEVCMWLPIAVLFMVPLCAPMILSISYCVAKLMSRADTREPASE